MAGKTGAAKRGMLIAFEGIDGSGKTTQAKRFYEALVARGTECILTKEMTDGAIGMFLRQTLREKGNDLSMLAAQLLFVADRADHVAGLIAPGIAGGKTIITDRYSASTIAYGTAHGLDMEWLISIHSKFPKPDATFYIKTSPNTANARLEHRKRDPNSNAKTQVEMFDNLESLVAITKVYDTLANADKSWIVIDGDRTEDEVFESIIAAWH